MENVTLTPEEQARLQVLNSLLAEHMTLDQAATLMGVTTRHTRRILAACQEKGAVVSHGHQGRRPVKKPIQGRAEQRQAILPD
jgi:MarR-like DNA-binding transcriptional regulator SgrR of sgrS sRNA